MTQKYQTLILNILLQLIIIHFLTKKIDVKIKQKNLVDKSAIAGLKNNDDVDKKKQRQHLIQVILAAKVILKMMVLKII